MVFIAFAERERERKKSAENSGTTSKGYEL